MSGRFIRRLVRRVPEAPFPGLPSIPVRPIGWVRNDIRDPDRHDWSAVQSRLLLLPDLAPALEGLHGFSHLIVVCWLDRVSDEDRQRLQVHPAGDVAVPPRGVLALRTHHRPNPIGVSVVALRRIEGTTLHVRGLDAADRTPVLDLKPYLPPYDSVPNAALAEWAH